MKDYSKYQGPSSEWEDFVRNNPLPPTNVTMPPEQIRAATNALRVQISQRELDLYDLRDKVHYRDYSILTRDYQNIVARVYRPRQSSPTTLLPTYLYFHGGGHLLGTVETEDAACYGVVAATGCMVVNVNYRHTPEWKHPTQVNDAWDSFEWLAQNISVIAGDPKRIMVGGLSAGAGLAASIIVREYELLRSGNSTSNLTIRGQLLSIPMLIHASNHPFASAQTSSYKQNVDAAVLPWSLLKLFFELLNTVDPSDPSLNVALVDDEKVRGMPPTSFLIAGQDLLRDEGLFYAEKLERNNVATKVHIFPGLPHGFRRFTDLPASKRWNELIAESCQWFLADKAESSLVVEDTRAK